MRRNVLRADRPHRGVLAGIVMSIATALVGAAADGRSSLISEAEASQPPTAQRLATIQAAARESGWDSIAPQLRAAAFRAYEKQKLPAAEAWLNAYHWAALWGESEHTFVPRWIGAINAAKVGHANMPGYPMRPVPMGRALSPELQAWLFANQSVSAEFFAALSPLDHVPSVFESLEAMYRRGSARFTSHARLAIAIALVFDVPPPPDWPHGQVPAQALPRRLPAPADAFVWWTKQEQSGRTYHRLGRLGIEDLKFVVDSAAPFAELEWAQAHCPQPLSQLAATYAMIRYRNDRVTGGIHVWLGTKYRLEDILAAGGICADQAYFAAHAGKARGVPTLYIYGAGRDGRHAWFGFLDANQKWHLDAGRYAEQRYVTGYARDPQTWAEFSDHELQFLTERFREQPSFRHSQVHAAMAAAYLSAGEPKAATMAARQGVTVERRNHAAWETLIAAMKADAAKPIAIENTLREAALAFQRYPDLEAAYANRVAESLRGRGQVSEAEAEIRRIAVKNQAKRGDLSVRQARTILQQALATDSLPQQIQAYNRVMDTYGRGASVAFFDEVVSPFIAHLLQANQPAEAAKALERARRTLRVIEGGQLQQEMDAIAQRLKKAK